MPGATGVILSLSAPNPRLPKNVSMAVVAAIMALTVVGREVHADDAAASVRPSGELASQIQQELDHEASHERLWWNGWMTAYAGLTVGQGIAAGVSSNYDTRVDQGVGAATSFLGVIGLLISRLPEIQSAAEALRAMPADNEEANRARDAAAIHLRAQAASAECEERSWVVHALNFAVTGASSLILWKGFGLGTESAENLSGIAVGELQIWTQPAALIGDARALPVAAPSSEIPGGPQRSLRLAWNGQLLRIVFAF
jgi:hypothetical protein